MIGYFCCMYYGNVRFSVSVVSCSCADQTSRVNKVKTLEHSLKFLLDCQQPLAALTAQLTADAADDIALQDEAAKLASIIQSRLQATLLNLIKNSSATGKNKYVAVHIQVTFCSIHDTPF